MKKLLIFISTNLIGFCINAQETGKEKDTLYFKLDNKYVYKSKYDSKAYLLKDSSYGETFFFEELETHHHLKPKKILSLKRFVRSSEFYNKKRKVLSDFKLYNFLEQYTVFLVKKDRGIKKYIKVYPLTEIE